MEWICFGELCVEKCRLNVRIYADRAVCNYCKRKYEFSNWNEVIEFWRTHELWDECPEESPKEYYEIGYCNYEV